MFYSRVIQHVLSRLSTLSKLFPPPSFLMAYQHPNTNYALKHVFRRYSPQVTSDPMPMLMTKNLVHLIYSSEAKQPLKYNVVF